MELTIQLMRDKDFFYSGRNDVIFPTGETSEYKMVVADMKRGLTEKD